MGTGKIDGAPVGNTIQWESSIVKAYRPMAKGTLGEIFCSKPILPAIGKGNLQN